MSLLSRSYCSLKTSHSNLKPEFFGKRSFPFESLKPKPKRRFLKFCCWFRPNPSVPQSPQRHSPATCEQSPLNQSQSASMSNWQWPGFNHEKKNTGIPSDIHDILLPPYQICTCQGHLQLPLQISSIYKEHIVRLHVLRFRPCLAYGYQKPPQRKIWTIYLSKEGHASAF